MQASPRGAGGGGLQLAVDRPLIAGGSVISGPMADILRGLCWVKCGVVFGANRLPLTWCVRGMYYDVGGAFMPAAGFVFELDGG